MLQSYKKIKYQHTKNQKKQEMEMPDNKQVSNLLKKKKQSAPNGKSISGERFSVWRRLIYGSAPIKKRTLGCPDFIPTQGYRRMLVTNEAIDTRILIELTQ